MPFHLATTAQLRAGELAENDVAPRSDKRQLPPNQPKSQLFVTSGWTTWRSWSLPPTLETPSLLTGSSIQNLTYQNHPPRRLRSSGRPPEALGSHPTGESGLPCKSAGSPILDSLISGQNFGQNLGYICTDFKQKSHASVLPQPALYRAPLGISSKKNPPVVVKAKSKSAPIRIRSLNSAQS